MSLGQSNERMERANLIIESSDSQNEKTEISSLEKLELQLKEIWSQYIHCLDKYGLNETAKEIKLRYLNLYQNYKNYRNWKDAVGD